MKTKLVPFVPPEESTIYNPPLFVFVDGDGKYIYAYVKGICYPFVTERGGYSVNVDIKIEVPDEPKRLTYLQLAKLMNTGVWMLKDSSTEKIHFSSPPTRITDLDKPVGNMWLISKIDLIEWIEPTTDLL